MPVVGATTGTAINQILQNKRGNVDKPIHIVNQILRSKVYDWPEISGQHTIEQDVAATNRGRYNTGLEYSQNCQRCVMAYEARRRGYDVCARPCILNARDPLMFSNQDTGWPSVFVGSDVCDIGSRSGDGCRENIEKVMRIWGDGARAVVAITYSPSAGGHVFVAEQVNGRTVFCDPQTGEVGVSDYFNGIVPQKTKLMRMDNLDFTSAITECCTAVAE